MPVKEIQTHTRTNQGRILESRSRQSLNTKESFRPISHRSLLVAATSISKYVSGWCGHGFESYSQPFCADVLRRWFKLMTFCFQLWYRRFNHSKNGLFALNVLIRNQTKARAMIKGATRGGIKRASTHPLPGQSW